MRCAEHWTAYELLDCTRGERLERWGDVILIRPDPQIIWDSPPQHHLWERADARYLRSNQGGGSWEIRRKITENWNISYQNLSFSLKLMGFKHTGLFPEQAVNWDFLTNYIKNFPKKPKVLNLFAYTGAATLACLAAGADVTHVDAARGMIQRARENLELSGLQGRPVRWIVDDCVKFVQRELRRGNRYDIILLDPPSYGRGNSGEIWKLSEQLFPLLALCNDLLQPGYALLLLNSYSAEFSPAIMEYIVKKTMGGNVTCEEIGLRVTSTGLILPCGNTTICTKK